MKRRCGTPVWFSVIFLPENDYILGYDLFFTWTQQLGEGDGKLTV